MIAVSGLVLAADYVGSVAAPTDWSADAGSGLLRPPSCACCCWAAGYANWRRARAEATPSGSLVAAESVPPSSPPLAGRAHQPEHPDLARRAPRPRVLAARQSEGAATGRVPLAWG
ncbi:MAG: hypothetical protein R2712_14565 [Vicinamibacterales bacterium]